MPGRFVYVFNPACVCDWCMNGGSNPRPVGYFAALGYDEPHIPPPGARLSQPPMLSAVPEQTSTELAEAA